ncbi:MAG TPA: hypothetical protein VGD42_00175 [Lysobacter sp.]
MASNSKGAATRRLRLLAAVVIAVISTVSAQDIDDETEELGSDTDITVDVMVSGPVAKSASQEESLGAPVQDVQLSFKEMCKTEEGRRLILNDEDARAAKDNLWAITLKDQEMQWQGMKANDLPTEATFAEYRKAALHRRCTKPPLATFVLAIPQPLGTCDNIRFGPPHYDLAGTVQRVRELEAYYRTTTDPWAGANQAERSANLKTSVATLLGSIEANLRVAYLNTGCHVGNTGRCAASTGEKRVCERVYIDAPPHQVLVPESLKRGRHVKEGPVLESPTRAWFRVGKTGHGENWGTSTADSKFDDAGANAKSRMDVDAIRRELIKQKLPTDQQPAKIPTPTTPTPKPEVKPAQPARISVRGSRRGNFYDVYVRNDGGSTGTVAFRVWYLDNFFSGGPKWKEKATLSFTLDAGKEWSATYHDFHSDDWKIERLQ